MGAAVPGPVPCAAAGRSGPKALRDLQVAHLRAVLFENLSIHLGEPTFLDEEALLDKVVTRRRGGFCYELNGSFSFLLAGLGFEVRLLAARVHGDGSLGPPFDHLVLSVDAGRRWLVDVGFGDHSLRPLRMEDPAPQDDPAGTFEVVAAGTEDGDLDVLRDGRPQYRIETRPRALVDFAPTCWWQTTSPDSHFTRSLVCTLPTENGSVTLSDRRLIRTAEGRRDEHTLTTDEEVLAAYRDLFGIRLDRLLR